MATDEEFDKQRFLQSLARRVSKLRKSKGYSMDRLALEGGFSRGTLSKIEAGLVDPKASTLARIGDILDVHPSKFFEIKKT